LMWYLQELLTPRRIGSAVCNYIRQIIRQMNVL